jgi:cell volume regulation protein A
MPILSLTTPAIVMLAFGVLLATSVLVSKASARTGVPLTLIFLGVGMLAGSEGIGGIAFGDYEIALWLGTAALAFILFDGGLNTPPAAMRSVIRPAGVLATVGVLGTAALVALAGSLAGLEWQTACMIGAIVSSTDAAAVFSVLRASGVHLKRRVGMTLEVESGVNDPVAFILTTVVVQVVANSAPISVPRTALAVVLELGIGAIAGIVIGRAGRWVLKRFPVRPSGLVPAFTIAVASLAYGVPALLHGSGFLSVYLAGMMIGAERLPYHTSVQRVHDTLAWLSQIGMFLVLGLLAFPARILGVWPLGVALALVLAFFARPAAVLLCLAPFGYNRREIAFIGWVGLRGAVPIVLATLPVIMQVPNAERVFDVVFVIVVVNALLQGMSVPWLAHRLRVESADPSPPEALLEIEGPTAFDTEIQSYQIDELLPVCGALIVDVPLPATSSPMLVIRGSALLTPTPELRLEPGDHAYLLVESQDGPMVQLLFGRPEGT